MLDVSPLRVLLLAFAGRVHREQAATIAYLVDENRVLKEQLHGRRLRLTDDQRRRLAAKGKARPSDAGCSRASRRWSRPTPSGAGTTV